MWSSKICVVLALAAQALAVIPQPASISTGKSAVWINKDTAITYNGKALNYAGATDESDVTQDGIIAGGVHRAIDAILNKGLVPWKLVPRGGLASFQPSTSDRTFIKTLAITVTGGAPSNNALNATTAEEAYKLTIGTDGAATINAATSSGVLRALQSFVQLFYKHEDGVSGSYTKLAPISIADEPRLIYRGVNLDVARSWYEVDDILRTIEGLAQNKLNSMHLHMTDSQSWPLEIPALPELAQKGAYAAGLTYKPSDIERIQQFALRRGIRVNVEIDMPGHTTAISLAYPELVAAANAKPWSNYCAEPPCGTLQLNNPKVDSFIDTLFGDLMPRLAKYSTMFHTGGDEVNANSYTLDPTTKSSDTATIAKGIQRLVDRAHAQIRKAGMIPMVWEEMVFDWNINLGKDVIVGTWHDGFTAKAVQKGYRTIGSSSDYWYLDCGHGGWINYNNANAANAFPFNDYCSPVKNWRKVYYYDPWAGIPADKQSLLYGAEVHLWSEQTDGVNVDDMLWPRGSAAAEVMWSGRRDAKGQLRDQFDVVGRLAEIRERMVLHGFRSGPVQMPHCTQHDPSECA
ncbi:hypothetical protein VHEMI01345 [[Torrubiella] hemipterigena]|uniref:Beta-hexosaminidase n=1 Tax=[Torrubiella] hemipterigena TaxID=1531966 RepID=A0A0A1T4I9_9HYPO|nr:hypothetical protein VHEMI01345 [[Torrubiella] hemipterigena]